MEIKAVSSPHLSVSLIRSLRVSHLCSAPGVRTVPLLHQLVAAAGSQAPTVTDAPARVEPHPDASPSCSRPTANAPNLSVRILGMERPPGSPASTGVNQEWFTTSITSSNQPWLGTEQACGPKHTWDARATGGSQRSERQAESSTGLKPQQGCLGPAIGEDQHPDRGGAQS